MQTSRLTGWNQGPPLAAWGGGVGGELLRRQEGVTSNARAKPLRLPSQPSWRPKPETAARHQKSPSQSYQWSPTHPT